MVLKLALSQPDGRFRDQLMDIVSAFDSIADVTRQALDAMLPNAEERARLLNPTDNGEGESDDSEIVR